MGENHIPSGEYGSPNQRPSPKRWKWMLKRMSSKSQLSPMSRYLSVGISTWKRKKKTYASHVITLKRWWFKSVKTFFECEWSNWTSNCCRHSHGGVLHTQPPLIKGGFHPLSSASVFCMMQPVDIERYLYVTKINANDRVENLELRCQLANRPTWRQQVFTLKWTEITFYHSKATTLNAQ